MTDATSPNPPASVVCPTCYGRGWNTVSTPTIGGWEMHNETCLTCHGSGSVPAPAVVHGPQSSAGEGAPPNGSWRIYNPGAYPDEWGRGGDGYAGCGWTLVGPDGSHVAHELFYADAVAVAGKLNAIEQVYADIRAIPNEGAAFEANMTVFDYCHCLHIWGKAGIPSVEGKSWDVKVPRTNPPAQPEPAAQQAAPELSPITALMVQTGCSYTQARGMFWDEQQAKRELAAELRKMHEQAPMVYCPTDDEVDDVQFGLLLADHLDGAITAAEALRRVRGG